MNPKAGWQTSEFWLTMAATIISLLVAVGVVKPAQAADVQAAVAQIVVAGCTLVANIWLIVRYVQGRTELKSLEPDDDNLPFRRGGA